MDSKEIGRRINTALASRDVKQKALAAYLGVPDNTISYFCSGARTPNVKQLVEIAKFLNTTPDYLLGFTEAMSREEDKRNAEEYTGLSSTAVQFLHDYKEEYPGRVESLSNLLQSEILDGLLLSLANLKEYCNAYPAIIEDERKELDNLSPEGLSACQVRTYKRRQNLYGELWAYSDYAQRLATVIYPITETRDALDKLYEELSQKGAKDDG